MAATDPAGLVNIGGDRTMYLECSGSGSPTVVLIAGKDNGAADWSEALDSADPAHDADCDALAWGKGKVQESASGVFPTVSRFTRVALATALERGSTGPTSPRRSHRHGGRRRAAGTSAAT